MPEYVSVPLEALEAALERAMRKAMEPRPDPLTAAKAALSESAEAEADAGILAQNWGDSNPAGNPEARSTLRDLKREVGAARAAQADDWASTVSGGEDDE